MSVARINYVAHARQPYAKIAKLDEDGHQVAVPVTSKQTGQQKTGRGGRPMTKRVTVRDTSQPLPLLKCGHCGDTINVGDPYLWFSVGFRSHYKQVRCRKSTCFPRDSVRESSGIRSGILAAIEGFNDDLDALDSESTTEATDVVSLVNQVGDSFREAADQWREADEAFGGGGATENGERADTAESSADELEGWTNSGQDEPDYEDCENEEHEEFTEADAAEGKDAWEKLDRGDSECSDCTQIRENWFNELIDEARDAVEYAEIP